MDKRKQGKKNRASGAAWERKVRADLIEKGWIVTKWMNNVEWDKDNINRPPEKRTGKCVPAKRKYNPFNRALSVGVGFPDFFAYQEIDKEELWLDSGAILNPANSLMPPYQIVFVECKTNGYLDKTEKEKAQWYLDNNYCSKFLIAHKVKQGRKVIVKYKDFEDYNAP